MKASLVPAVPVEQTVWIEMTRDQAVTLKAICNKIGGNLRESYREHTDELGRALFDVGIEAGIGDRFSGTLTGKDKP